ncbi:MAG: DUF2339 domain-containing protein [Bernardetiaceae bacterium]|nr:DUF2339 domain-containing protein [Bernardetiaceae bacterium]
MNEKEEVYRQITALLAQLDDMRAEVVHLRARVAEWENSPETKTPPKLQGQALLDMLKRLDAEQGPERDAPESPAEPPETEKPKAKTQPEGPPAPPPRPKPKPAPAPPFSFEKWASKNLKYVGIGVFVLGMVYLVKYAIDNNWIDEWGRVLIGVATGGGLLALAHYLRARYHAFSSVLVGGGVALLYFTFYWAYHGYQLLGPVSAFAAMLVVTLYSVGISLAYNRQELTVIATIGGFATPFLANSGSGNYVALFSYLALLNAGILGICLFKRWAWPKQIAYWLTWLIFTGWWVARDTYPSERDVTVPALAFATLFFGLFFSILVAYNVRHRTAFHAGEVMMLLSNQFIYFMLGMSILAPNWWDSLFGEPGATAAPATFTGLLALLNLGLAYWFYRPALEKQTLDKLLFFLVLGSGLTFLALIAPVALRGNTITLAWAAEALLLWWLGQRSGLPLFRAASLVVLFLGGWSLLLDWRVYGGNFFNYYSLLNNDWRGQNPLVGTLGLVAALAGLFGLSRQDARATPRQRVMGIELEDFPTLFGLALLACTYTGLLLEVRHQCQIYLGFYWTEIATAAYNLGFAWLGWWLAAKVRRPYFHWLVLLATGVVVLVSYPFFWQFTITAARNGYLTNGQPGLGVFLSHYLLLALTVPLVWRAFTQLRTGGAELTKTAQSRLIHPAWAYWLLGVWLVFHLSAEFSHGYVFTYFSQGGFTPGHATQGAAFTPVRPSPVRVWPGQVFPHRLLAGAPAGPHHLAGGPGGHPPAGGLYVRTPETASR